MNTPLQIGITGGIGSGKSLVCKIFQCLGIPIYDADRRAKSLMTTDGILMTQITKEFGDLVYDRNGMLDRQYLGDVVFKDESKLARLNELVHPRVGVDYKKWVTRQKKVPYVIKEAALLFESGSHKQLDKIIVVSAPADIRSKRVLIRDKHRSASQLEEIMKRQLPEQEKVKLADYVLLNDETTLLIPQVVKLHEEFKSYVP